MRQYCSDMELLKDVNNKIAESKTEMLASLSNLISIPSVAIEAGGSKPFGDKVQEAFEYMLKLAEDEGFEVYNADNFGGHIDFKGTEDGIVGIVGHLDVVPEGDGWDFEPYGGVISDGKLYGRGAIDDKGPVMASFYGMKALKECGYKPKRTIRLILGLDEETNWNGMNYYLEHVDSLPDFGFTPDGDFPAIHGEKGILVFDIAKRFNDSAVKGLELSSVKGGTAANAVADFARAVLYDSSGAGYDRVKEQAAAFRMEKGCKINCKGIGKSLEITVHGVSAHGAKPDKGINAISIIMEFLGRLNFANEDTNDFIGFFNDCIGYDFHGERIGCDFEDEPSGKLILNVGMIAMDKKTVQLTINIRYPVTMDDEQVYEGIMTVLDRYELGVVKGSQQDPIYIPADDPLIETLMEIYRRHTGDYDGQPLVIGGGTYARAMENTVAFGAMFPEDPDLCHQRNEYITVDNMVKLAEIYAEAAYRLSELE